MTRSESTRTCSGCHRTLTRAHFQLWANGKRNGLHQRCDACRDIARGNPAAELTCPACGKTFFVKSTTVERRVYCSVACRFSPAPPPKPKSQREGPNPSGMCMCGCGEPAAIATKTRRSRGNVAGKPLRYADGHTPKSRKPGFLPIRIAPDTGCWEWVGARYGTGYGCVRRSGRVRHAHRFVYEQMVGPIPDGLELDHLCRNRSCVNPDHLEPVTHAENVRRAARTKLTVTDVAEIRQLYGRAPTKEIAARFGVAYSTVVNVARGRRWRDHGVTSVTAEPVDLSTNPAKIQ